MKCGRGHDHGTVAEVRECYGVSESAPSIRPNKYAGDCVKCRNEVPATTGRIERNEAGKYDVYHLDGECGEIRPEPAKRQRGGMVPEGVKTIPDGYYATASLTGNNDYDFWRVYRLETYPGRIFVKRVIGGKPETPVRGATRYGALGDLERRRRGWRYAVRSRSRSGHRGNREPDRCVLSRSLGIGPVWPEQVGGRDDGPRTGRYPPPGTSRRADRPGDCYDRLFGRDPEGDHTGDRARPCPGGSHTQHSRPLLQGWIGCAMSKTYRAVVEPSKEAIDVWADNKEDAVTMDRMELLFTVGDRSETKITPDDLVRSLLRDAHLARWMDLASVEQIDADECIGLRPAPGSPELEPEPEVCGICRKEHGAPEVGSRTAR